MKYLILLLALAACSTESYEQKCYVQDSLGLCNSGYNPSGYYVTEDANQRHVYRQVCCPKDE